MQVFLSLAFERIARGLEERWGNREEANVGVFLSFVLCGF